MGVFFWPHIIHPFSSGNHPSPSFWRRILSSFPCSLTLSLCYSSETLGIPRVFHDLGISCSQGPAVAMGLGQREFHGEHWNRALFPSANQEFGCMFSGDAASMCNTWVAPKQPKAEQRAKKRSRNFIVVSEPWIPPCPKPNLPLGFSHVSLNISLCV